MLKHIKAALGNISRPSNKPTEKEKLESLRFAVAILLVEVIHADHQIEEQEISMVINVLQQQFEIDESAARDLFEKANEEMKDVVSLHQYTSHINSALSSSEKQNLMTNLWRVIFSDGQVDRYEEHLVRRVADLIHVSHKKFINAKHLAQKHPEI